MGLKQQKNPRGTSKPSKRLSPAAQILEDLHLVPAEVEHSLKKLDSYHKEISQTMTSLVNKASLFDEDSGSEKTQLSACYESILDCISETRNILTESYRNSDNQKINRLNIHRLMNPIEDLIITALTLKSELEEGSVYLNTIRAGKKSGVSRQVKDVNGLKRIVREHVQELSSSGSLKRNWAGIIYRNLHKDEKLVLELEKAGKQIPSLKTIRSYIQDISENQK